MPNILGARQRSTLAHFATSNVLIAFDYDGTLAPVTSNPQRARMRARTTRLLSAVAERYPCVVISGRSRSDIARRVESIPVWHVAGNHGVEPWGESEIYASRVRAWMRPLERQTAGHAGVVVEDKTYSVTVHYRHARDKRDAVKVITEAARRLKGACVVVGSQAVTILPRGAPDKGIALERARTLLACDTIIYVGDDETDEAAFRAARPERLLAVRIGANRRSRARHWLRSQVDMDAFLQTLLSLRTVRHRRRPSVTASASSRS
jgi:trehalose 6-phosphate phosphatase